LAASQKPAANLKCPARGSSFFRPAFVYFIIAHHIAFRLVFNIVLLLLFCLFIGKAFSFIFFENIQSADGKTF